MPRGNSKSKAPAPAPAPATATATATAIAPAPSPAPQPTSELASSLGIVSTAVPSAPSTQTGGGLEAGVEEATSEPVVEPFDRTTLFPSLVQRFRVEFSDSATAIAAILEAVAKSFGVSDETRLWHVVKPKTIPEILTLLREYLSSPEQYFVNWVVVVLSNWLNSFTPPAVATYREAQTAVLKALLLDGEFHTGDYDVLAYLAAHVKTGVRLFRDTVRNWSPAEGYRGPFSTMCQGSGMGKTRLALQLASLEHMHVLYICGARRPRLVGPESYGGGYPAATEVIEPFIRANGLDGAVWRVLLVAILTEYCAMPGLLDDTAMRQQWLRAIVANDEDGKRFWRNVLARYARLCAEATPGNRPLPLTLPASAHFVFVVDDAASFANDQAVRSTATGAISQVSILQRLRHALRVLGRHENVFGLFLDADTQICRLPPTTDNHRYLTPTMREEDLLMVQPERVLPPFGPLPMCHPGPTPRHLRHHALLYHPLGGGGGGGGGGGEGGGGDGGVQVSYCPATLALSSRPLFAMHVHRQLQSSQSSEVSFGRQAQVLNEARHTAQVKLLGATSFGDLQEIWLPDGGYRDVARLAVLGCRYGGVASAGSTEYQQRLLRQHLATCYGASDDGKDLIVGYPSEPWLAEAAAELMLKTGAFQVLMEALSRMVVRGSLALSTGSGEMAALVVRLALSRAFDRACARLRRAAAAAVADTAAADPSVVCSTLCRPVPLVEVLVELYGGSSDTDQADQARRAIVALLAGTALGHGIVMFNHFVQRPGSDPVRDVAAYKALLRRGAAVMYPTGQAARDIVIPVALPRDLDRTIDLWHSDSYVLTTWEIQVHHWSAAFRVRDVVAQMVATPTTETVDRRFYESADRHPMVFYTTTAQPSLSTSTGPSTASTTSTGPSTASTTSTGPSTASTAATSTDRVVPILYSAVNTLAGHATDMRPDDVGAILRFDEHWAMSPSVAFTTANASATAAETAAETTARPPSSPRVSLKTKCLADDDADDADTRPLTVSKRPRTTPSTSNDVVACVDTAMETTTIAATTAAPNETAAVAVVALQLCGLNAFAVFDAAERDAVQRLLTPPVDATAMGPLRDYHATFLHATVEEALQRVACLRPEYHHRRSEDDNGGAPPCAERGEAHITGR